MTDHVGAPDQHLGRLERHDGRSILEFTRHLPHPPATVWRALTEGEQLVRWFPTTIEGDLAVGAPLRFAFRDLEIEPMVGAVLACEPPFRLAFQWGPDTLRFELRADGNGTVLSLTVVLEELGKAARDGAGWHTCLDLLEYQVDGEPAPWSDDVRWKQVHPVYVEQMGPEASAIGPPVEWERAHGSEDGSAGGLAGGSAGTPD